MGRFGSWARGLFGAKEEPGPYRSSPMLRVPTPSGSQSFVEDNNDFALATYAEVRQRPGNLFCSPFSVRAALVMTLAGARGETAAQMREALRISSLDETVHASLAAIIRRLNLAGGGKYEMAVANSLWSQEGAPLQTGFLDLIAGHYAGDLNLVDFRSGAEAARLRINQHVEDKTRQKITWGTVDMCGPLTALGMALSFDRSRADFSGINGHQPPHEEALFISAVFHKAFVDVNEEGTEAAAATVTPTIALRPSKAPETPIFRADHPFIFVIRDRTSGAILFLGRIGDPTQES